MPEAPAAAPAAEHVKPDIPQISEEERRAMNYGINPDMPACPREAAGYPKDRSWGPNHDVHTALQRGWKPHDKR